MISVEQISGIGGFYNETEKIGDDKTREVFFVVREDGEKGKVFLVKNKNTLEMRCDNKLSGLLKEKYESVMESRYFGRGGIEVVDAGQFEKSEMEDLIRLSYNMSKE